MCTLPGHQQPHRAHGQARLHPGARAEGAAKQGQGARDGGSQAARCQWRSCEFGFLLFVVVSFEPLPLHKQALEFGGGGLIVSTFSQSTLTAGNNLLS